MKVLLFKLLGMTLLLGCLFGGWHWMGYQQFVERPVTLSEPLTFVINNGDRLQGVASRLQQQKVISSADYFYWLGRIEGSASKIKRGEYQIQPGILPRVLMDQLTSGKSIQYALTIIEGMNFRELLERVRSSSYLSHELQGESSEAIMKQLGLEGVHWEGRFLPDTYHFPKGESDRQFLLRAYAAMQTLLQQEWERRIADLPLKSAEEALILASIIEKETGKAAERQQIAGVFTRRLKKRMRLQTDPTVIYGVGDRFDGNLTRKHLRTDTPYNTYTRYGLPPTPIAMPGRAAIQAALHPAEGDSLYFVAKGDGSHQFSPTLKEHNRAVTLYQLKRR